MKDLFKGRAENYPVPAALKPRDIPRCLRLYYKASLGLLPSVSVDKYPELCFVIRHNIGTGKDVSQHEFKFRGSKSGPLLEIH